VPSETVPTTAARKATRNHPAAEAAKDFLDLTTGNYRTLLVGRCNLNAAPRDVTNQVVSKARQPFGLPRGLAVRPTGNPVARVRRQAAA
jgi:hypothetical protein